MITKETAREIYNHYSQIETVEKLDTRRQKINTTNTDEWYTPKWLIDKLGQIDLDPCAAPVNDRPFQIAPLSYSKEDDGLSKTWSGFVYGIALLINRQDNLLWQDVIFPTAKSMIFMRHRVKFIRPGQTKSSPFFGSCLVAWGDEADQRLRTCGIEGKYVVLNL